MNLFGIEGWGFAVDLGSCLFGVKLATAEEVVEMDEDDDLAPESNVLIFFAGPFSFMLIF